LFNDAGAQVRQYLWNVDLDRASVVASAAQGGRERQGRRVFYAD
jgi:hypothetical protein